MIMCYRNFLFVVLFSSITLGCAHNQPISGPNTLRINNVGMIAGGELKHGPKPHYAVDKHQTSNRELKDQDILAASQVVPASYNFSEKQFPISEDPNNLFEQILGSAIDWGIANQQDFLEGGTLKVPLLLFVHGGLNHAGNAEKRNGKANTLTCLLYFEDPDAFSKIEQNKLEKDCSDYGLIDRIKTAENAGDRYYPVFLEWNSALFDSYGHHLTKRVSDRETKVGWFGVQALFKLPADLAVNVARVPEIELVNLTRLNTGFWAALNKPNAKLNGRRYKTAHQNYCFFHGPPRIDRFCENITKYEYENFIETNLKHSVVDKSVGDIALRILDPGVLAQHTVGLVYQGAIAESSWQVMQRRVTNIPFPYSNYELASEEYAEQSIPTYPTDQSDGLLGKLRSLCENNPEKCFDTRVQAIPRFGGSDLVDVTQIIRSINTQLGSQNQGVSVMEFFNYLMVVQNQLDKLEQFSEEQRLPKIQFELTFVGHSMGAIAINNILSEVGPYLASKNILKDVVYMAAADSVRNTINAVAPTMRASLDSCGVGNPLCSDFTEEGVRFFNLTLAEYADIKEKAFCLGKYWNWLCGVPSGSLLVNIDDLYEKPSHPVDATMGREANMFSAMRELYTSFYPMNSNTYFKAFDYVSGEPPFKHGHFSEEDFWEESFWLIDNAANAYRVQE